MKCDAAQKSITGHKLQENVQLPILFFSSPTLIIVNAYAIRSKFVNRCVCVCVCFVYSPFYMTMYCKQIQMLSYYKQEMHLLQPNTLT